MAQVSNQQELLLALANSEPLIEITADFEISVQNDITYSVSIKSMDSSPQRTLKRQAGFSGTLFLIQQSGALTLQNIILDGNKGNTPASENLQVQSLVTVVSGALAAETTILQNNGAYGSGGAVYISGIGSMLSLKSCCISHNTSAISGGGIYASNGPSASLTDCTFTDNIASVNGGGIAVESCGDSTTLHMSECRLNRNTGADGGAIYASGIHTTVSILETMIELNTAIANGGGLQIADSLRAEISSCILSENSAANGGGGITIQNASGDMLTDTVIANNTALIGAGIYVNGNMERSAFEISGCTIGANRAMLGGGIAAFSTELTITGNTVLQNNTAENGGGIYQYASAVLHLSPGCKIINNAASNGSGGGIYSNDATDIMKNIFISNTASESGGAFYIRGIGSVQATDSVITNNQADNGGAVYADNGGNYTGINIILSGNSASNNGGAIYIDENGFVCLQDNVTVQNNTAQNAADGIYNVGILAVAGAVSISDGVYLVSSDNKIQVDGSLANASIQLDCSSYVTSSPVGIPVRVAVSTPAYPVLAPQDEAAFKKPLEEFENWQLRRNKKSNEILLIPFGEYQIFYKNLMEAVNPNPNYYSVQATAIVLQNPGPVIAYRFIGWYDALQGGNQITKIRQGSIGDITLYAHWELIVPASYRLTYYGNDAGGPPAEWISSPVNILEGRRYTLSPAIPTREGFYFTGWNLGPDGTGAAYQPGDIIGPVYSEIKLYAQWIVLPPVYHTLYFYANDAGGPPARGIPEPLPLCDGETVCISARWPLRPCFHFTGWNTEPSGSGATYLPGQPIEGDSSDIKLYANWEAI